MLAILYHATEHWPILVAANREEFYDRPGTPPELWTGEVPFVAGRDSRAGGTWLGVNRHRILVAITNRSQRSPPPHPRSRGLLCRDLLGACTAREARDRALTDLGSRRYAGCNILVADQAEAYVFESGETLRPHRLSFGPHVVTTWGLNQATDSRAAEALARLERLSPSGTYDSFHELQRLCADHGEPGRPPICLHANDRGTVSASIIALGSASHDAHWLHAQGPPCRTSFANCDSLLTQLLT